MSNVWIQALQEYNKGKNKWCVVKKGTPEHAEVMKIMNRIKGGKEKDNSIGKIKYDDKVLHRSKVIKIFTDEEPNREKLNKDFSRDTY